ncbi:16880_t:CDS:1, partial [Cetraspora pellucida]
MAKSIRSKIKRRFRAIKRKTVFAPVEDARTSRLASKLSQDSGVTIQPKQQHNGIISDTSLA